MTALLTRREPVYDVIDDFCGAGFSSIAARDAGARMIQAVNHAAQPCETYALNNPGVDVRQQDLLDFDPRDRPRARLHLSSPSCLRHSRAFMDKLYQLGPRIADGVLLSDEDEAMFAELLRRDGTADHGEGGSVAEQERSRQTMVSPLLYAAVHKPEFSVIENVIEVCNWGYRREGGPKMGDGRLYRRWRKEWDNLGYELTELFLCSAAFGVPQYRNRVYIVARRKDVPKPDLNFRPLVYCDLCETASEGVQTWKKTKKTWPLERWGEYRQQYTYSCSRCSRTAELIAPPFYSILDTSDLGVRIGDVAHKINAKRLERMRRGYEKYKDEPGWVTTYAASHGSDRGLSDALPTLTSSRDRAVVLNGFTYVASGNTFEHPGQTRARSMWDPRTCITSSNTDGMVMLPPIAHTKVNGDPGATAWHHGSEPIGTIVGRDTTRLLMGPGMRAWVDYYYSGGYQSTNGDEPIRTLTSKDRARVYVADGGVPFEECTTRILKPFTEGVAGMGVPLDYLWPTKSGTDVMRLIGQGVTPPVLTPIIERCFDSLNEQRQYAA